jgi:hypothetical protein
MGASGLIGIAGLLAAAAFAPSAPSATWRGERPVSRGEAVAVAALRAYSACAARAAEAPLLLRTMPGSNDEAATLRALIKGAKGCRLNGQLRFQAYLLRGALAEALYPAEARKRGGALSPAPPGETFGTFTARLAAADRDGLSPVGRRILTWRWLAYCAAHQDPVAVAALLRSQPSGPGEVAALQTLRPALAGCLPEERWADLRAVAIRALLAEALYQRRLAWVAP